MTQIQTQPSGGLYPLTHAEEGKRPRFIVRFEQISLYTNGLNY